MANTSNLRPCNGWPGFTNSNTLLQLLIDGANRQRWHYLAPTQGISIIETPAGSTVVLEWQGSTIHSAQLTTESSASDSSLRQLLLDLKEHFAIVPERAT